MECTTGKEEAGMNSHWGIKDGPPRMTLLKWVFRDEYKLARQQRSGNDGGGVGNREDKVGKRNKM